MEGKRLRRKKVDGWSITVTKLIPKLYETIEKKALPFLAQYQSLEDIAKMREDEDDLNSLKAKAYALARIGKYKSATKQLSSLIEKIDYYDKLDDFDSRERPMYQNALLLKRTLSDPSKTQKLLNRWELETLRNLKLQKLAQM